jgi:hypothetical protein
LWYIFGYANNDWFGVTVVTLLLLFLNSSRMTFHRFAIGGYSTRSLQLVPILILLGLLCFSKPNYWVTAIFCFYEPLIRILRKKSPAASRIRAMAFSLILLVVTLLCVGSKSYFSHATERHIVQASEMKPRLGLDKTPELRARMSQTTSLYQHHVSFWSLLTARKWIWLSCRSFFGDFGWMNFHLTMSYYCLVVFLFAALLSTAVWISREEKGFFSTIFFTLLVIGANISSALAFSWFVDLQPQGRYLFPSLLAIGWMFSRLRQWQSSRIVFGLVLMLAILGMYAFIFYGVLPLKDYVPSTFL